MRLRLVLIPLFAWAAFASAAHAGFVESLSPERKKALGLNHLTAAQAADIDAAVDQYQGREDTRVLAKKAADSAVEEYKAKQQPTVVARALGIFKQREEENRIERFTTHIIGRFTGWGGGTLFALDNGQVWQQSGSEVYSLPAVESPEVEFRKAASGYHRLYLPNGAWVTVKRIR
ncbi:MAG: hypothetical protein JWQ62_2080 [Lacunisphaera sp.]|nr:hypothetical protein [Lacunisphaera sp.]